MYKYQAPKYPSLMVHVGKAVVRFEKGFFQTEDKNLALGLEKSTEVVRTVDSLDPNSSDTSKAGDQDDEDDEEDDEEETDKASTKSTEKTSPKASAKK